MSEELLLLLIVVMLILKVRVLFILDLLKSVFHDLWILHFELLLLLLLIILLGIVEGA